MTFEEVNKYVSKLAVLQQYVTSTYDGNNKNFVAMLSISDTPQRHETVSAIISGRLMSVFVNVTASPGLDKGKYIHAHVANLHVVGDSTKVDGMIMHTYAGITHEVVLHFERPHFLYREVNFIEIDGLET